MSEVHGLSGQNLAGFSTGAVGGEAVESGKFQGGSVAVETSGASRIADAAEEMSFARDNSRQVKLADRKQVKQSAPKGQGEKVKSLQKKMKASSDNKSKSEKLKNKSKSGQTPPEELEDEALELFVEPAEAYAALDEMSRNADNEEEAENFKKPAAGLKEKYKSRIDAMLNSLDDGEAAEKNTGVDALTNARNYCDALSNFTDAAQMLNYVQQHYGDRVDAGLDFMFKALSSDMNSGAPSHERALLESVAAGIGYARTLNSGIKDISELTRRLSAVHEMDTAKVKPMEVLHRLLSLGKARFVGSIEVRNLLQEVRGKNPEQEVLLAQELMNSLRNCSDALFDSFENRSAVMTAAQRLVDEKIAEEDEWLSKM